MCTNRDLHYGSCWLKRLLTVKNSATSARGFRDPVDPPRTPQVQCWVAKRCRAAKPLPLAAQMSIQHWTRGVRGAKCFLESSVDVLFFELFHVENARCGVEHNFRETCKNLQNMGNSRVSLAASLSNSTCNGFFELQGCEKRKKSFDALFSVL